MIEVDINLKPLSANLKRIKIGEALWKDGFSHLMEENLLDDFWESSKDEWRKTERLFMLESNDRLYTESFIIGLNICYKHYVQNKNEKAKKIFNDFLRLGLIYFTQNENKNIDKIIDILTTMSIVDEETITEIERVKINYNNALDKKDKPQFIKMNEAKKYQIFISSTFIDLKDERQAAVEAILKKGHIPAGMELFAANNKSQWEVIKKWIDDSDIYILLLGGRYGSIDDSTKLSYTEMEYKYAIEQQKPFFALVLDDGIINNKSVDIIRDYDLKNPSYISFKKDVTSKMCSFPNNIDQIKNHINTSLDDIIRDNNEQLIGWIRGDSKDIMEKKKS